MEKENTINHETVEERLDEVLFDGSFRNILNPDQYVDPTQWMKEHIQTHPDYLKSLSGAVSILPFTFQLGETGVGYTGKCICNLCKEEHSITDVDNW